LDAIPLDQIDLLITLGGEAKDSCESLPRKAERVHWPLVDPAAAHGDNEQVMQAFRSARDEIRARVQELLSKRP
jgi:arsenate reductase